MMLADEGKLEHMTARKFVVLQGPNLNRLGHRRPEKYGTETLDDISRSIEKRASTLGVEVVQLQSNHEGALIDFLHEHQDSSAGILINPAGLSVHGHALADAIADSRLPCVVVHLSCFEKYEKGRREDIYRFVGDAYVSGMRSRGYLYGLEALAAGLEHTPFW